jgi:hypothetical protein
MYGSRKISIGVALLVALFLGSPVSYGAQKEPNTRFSGIGTVVSVDEAGKTITIKVDRSSRLLRDKVDKEIAFKVAEDAFIGCGMGWAGCPLLHPEETEPMQTTQRLERGRQKQGETPESQPLSSVEVNDEVRFMGNVSDAGQGGELRLTQIMVWMF